MTMDTTGGFLNPAKNTPDRLSCKENQQGVCACVCVCGREREIVRAVVSICVDVKDREAIWTFGMCSHRERVGVCC